MRWAQGMHPRKSAGEVEPIARRILHPVPERRQFVANPRLSR